MDSIPYVLALTCYGFVSFAHLLPNVVGERAFRAVRGVAIAGVVLHMAALILTPYSGVARPGFPEALSAAALGIMLGYVAVGRERLKALGLVLSPLAVVFLGTSRVVPRHEIAALHVVENSAWLPVHLGLMVAGLGGFALAFALGCVYLYVRGRLKAKKLAGIRRLPSLEVLDALQFRAMLFGFVFLTLGIGVGGALAAATFDEAWGLDPKVTFTALIWLWYAVALQVRVVAGWRGRMSAIFSIVGFGSLVFSLVALNFLIGGFHARLG